MSEFEQCNCNTGEWQSQLCDRCNGTGQAAKQSMQGEAVAYICAETNELTFDPYEKTNGSYKALYTHAPDIADLQAQVEALRKDAERLNFIEKEMYDLRCISLPNADAGDFSEHWEVVSYHMDKPSARTEGHASTARIAIDAAISKGGE